METSNFKLLRFGVENFTSFREFTEVDFTSTSLKDEPSHRMLSSFSKYGVLPAIGVYGANASGKTNLIGALIRIRNLVVNSFNLRPEEPIPWKPWRMETASGSKPTRMEIDFELGKERFHYGFVHDSKGFHEEWLYRFRTKRAQLLFLRDHSNFSEPWSFGPSLKGEKTTIAKLTKPNTLFLSAAAHNNHELLKSVFDAIEFGIQSESNSKFGAFFFEDSPILNSENRQTIVSILRAFDLGCVDYSIKRIPKFSESKLFSDNDFMEELLNQSGLRDMQPYQLLLDRKSASGETWSLPPQFESQGTHVLLDRINELLGLRPGVFVVDEIDTSLHPAITAAILRLFTSEAQNQRGVQLLFSTHDLGLLEHLRRDEALIVEKNPDGVSSVSSMSDFKELRSRDNLRTIYEQGSVGGLPILGRLPPI